MQLSSRWSVSGWLASTTLATLAFWSIFGACVDASEATSSSDAASHGAPSPAAGSNARAIVAWDPQRCGEPHRVIVELEDPGGGAPLAASVPCALGEVTLDVPHAGVYGGRVYAWTADATVRSLAPLVLTLDAPVTRREVATPR